MNMPYMLVIRYQSLVRKLVKQFSTSKHKKMSTTNMYNVHQGSLEPLMDYLIHFNEATIKVIHLNQEMFLRAFQNGLRAGNLNEPLTR